MNPTTKNISEACEEAETLIAYGSKNAIKFDEESVITILKTRKKLSKVDQEISAEFETKFWFSYYNLSKSVQPASVSSIIATRDIGKAFPGIIPLWVKGGDYPIAHRLSSRFRVYTLIALITFVIIQVYWVFGSNILRENRQVTSAIMTIGGDIRKLQTDRRVARFTLDLNKTKFDLLDKNLEEARKSEEKSKIAKIETSKIDLQRIVDGLRGKLAAIDAGVQSKDGERRAIQLKLASGSFLTLKSWNRIWGGIFWFFDKPYELEEYRNQENKILQNEAEAKIAEYVLQSIATYALPFLLGFLGACTYILRRISLDIANRTFDPNSNIRYSLRLALGPLAGVAISLFFNFPDGAAVGDVKKVGPILAVEYLSPLALAFISGYAVELLFSLMDRIVSAFSGSQTKGLGT